MDRELHLPIGFQGDNTQDSMGEEEVDWNLVVVEEYWLTSNCMTLATF